jgi:general secretion pathway protein G
MQHIASRQRPWSARRSYVVLLLAFLGGYVLVVLVLHAVAFGGPGASRATKAKLTIVNLTNALRAYKVDVGSYPLQEAGLQALIEPPSDQAAVALWRGPYIDLDEVPRDPWGNEFVYVAPGSDGAPLELISLGRDGKPGGTGRDADISSRDLTSEHRQ